MKISRMFSFLFCITVIMFSVNIYADSMCYHVNTEYCYEDISGQNYHYLITKCVNCGVELNREKIEHYVGDYPEPDYYEKYNNTYHYDIYECLMCPGKTRELSKHDFKEKVIKLATPKAKGKLKLTCWDCNYTTTKSIPWRFGHYDCQTYNVLGSSPVYGYSNSITVKLERVLKGSVLKVKIGNKTYKKKLNNTKKKVTIPIKSHPVGSKITFKVVYKNKVIGKKESTGKTYVYYTDRMRTGLTTQQVRYTYGWGSPSGSGSVAGVLYWYYSDGSYIVFRNGVVNSWYDAAG